MAPAAKTRRARRRTWSPSDLDITIVETLTELAGDAASCVISRDELANRVGTNPHELSRRIRWLAGFGYVTVERRYAQAHDNDVLTRPQRIRPNRYTVVKTPAKTDVHDVGAYQPSDRAPGSTGDSTGGSSARNAGDGPITRTGVDEAAVVRLYADEQLSMRVIAGTLRTSYGTVHKIVTALTEPRPRGGPYRFTRRPT